MSSFKKLYLTIFSLFILLTINGCSLTNEISTIKVNNEVRKAQSVFIQALDTIEKEYIDDTLNHQDWNKWKNRYKKQIKTKDDAYIAIRTSIASLDDRYTRFLPPSEFEEQDRSIDSTLCGIGVHISEDKDGITIVDVIKDTPAEESKLKAGDKIIKVDGTSTKGMALSDVAEIVRGEAGTPVKLTILRNKKPIVKDVTRRVIHINTVESKMIENNIGYIKITSFISQDTSLEMATALNSLKDADGYVIDIRGNFGGLLPNAIFIASMFIEDGTIVSIVDKTGYKESINAQSFSVLTKKPMVVLINKASASASEILSGALKDHKRAKLIGTSTFGKGLVQKICRLKDGSGINITIAKYLTPDGHDINKIGVKPDIEVKVTEKDYLAHNDVQLKKAESVLKSEIRKYYALSKK